MKNLISTDITTFKALFIQNFDFMLTLFKMYKLVQNVHDLFKMNEVNINIKNVKR